MTENDSYEKSESIVGDIFVSGVPFPSIPLMTDVEKFQRRMIAHGWQPIRSQFDTHEPGNIHTWKHGQTGKVVNDKTAHDYWTMSNRTPVITN